MVGSETATFPSVHDFCLHVLESGDLRAKLVVPRGPDGGPLPDLPAPAVFCDRPARAPAIEIHPGADRLPKLGELRDHHARATCLERFANHELMAVELFAWALVAYPQMPRGLRRALLHVLEEEQGHVRLYLNRLAAVGSGLGEHRLSDYFWQQVPGIRASANGPASFLCVMGLTFEQANLDFSLLYRDAFRRHGDDPGAEALDRVHHDEIGHVRLAARWLPRVGRGAWASHEVRASGGGQEGSVGEVAGDGGDRARFGSDGDVGERMLSDVELYERFLPFPLSAARAKGRRFEAGPRRQAGLSEAFIAHVRVARPYAPRSAGTEVCESSLATAGPDTGLPGLPAAGTRLATGGDDVARVPATNGATNIAFANFGAEEDRDAKKAVPGLLRLLSLWEALLPKGTEVELPVRTFPPGTRALGRARALGTTPADREASSRAEAPRGAEAGMVAPGADWPGSGPAEPTPIPAGEIVRGSDFRAVWSELHGVVPWYADVAAARRAGACGLPLAVSGPAIVAPLHDKASCARFAARVGGAGRTTAVVRGSSPVPFPQLVVVLDPDDLRAPGAAEHIEARVAGWPAPWNERFTLKPRFGTSGRGRVHGRDGQLDPGAAAGISRLAERGGAILEPWVERVADLSAQYWIRRDGRAMLFGTTQQVLGENGIYLGNRGFWSVTDDGAFIVSSGLREDAEFRAATAQFIAAVVAPEFRGPCGIDGFIFRDGERRRLRPLVELNARFTAGTVALGWLARVLEAGGASVNAPGAAVDIPGGGRFRDAGEWWFALSPRYGQKLRGAQGAPRSEEGWTSFALGRGEDAPVLALRRGVR